MEFALRTAGIFELVLAIEIGFVSGTIASILRLFGRTHNNTIHRFCYRYWTCIAFLAGRKALFRHSAWVRNQRRSEPTLIVFATLIEIGCNATRWKGAPKVPKVVFAVKAGFGLFFGASRINGRCSQRTLLRVARISDRQVFWRVFFAW